MPVIPAGPISTWLSSVRTLLAACASFQARLSAEPGYEEDPAAIAAGHIFFDQLLVDEEELGQTLDAERPYAIVEIERADYRQVAEGAGIELVAGGSLWLKLTDVYRHDDASEAYLEFANWVGLIAEEMAELSGQDQDDEEATETYAPLKSIELALPPQRPPRTMLTAGHKFFTAVLRLTFGHEAGESA